MFVCQICGKQQRAGVSCSRIVVETRDFNHPFRAEVGPHRVFDFVKRKWRDGDDRGGIGKQIVKELNACPECAGKKV